MNEILITYIIVNWNTPDFVVEAVNSIYLELPTCDAKAIEVLIVDNASSGQDVLYIKQRCKFPNIRFIENTQNLGFAKACNQGLFSANGSYSIFFNSDASYLPGVSYLVIDLIKQGHLKDLIFGANVLNTDGSTQDSARGRFPNIRNAFNTYILGKIDDGLFINSDLAGNLEVDWISGVYLGAKTKTLQNIGGFPTDYFMYSEDILLNKLAHNLKIPRIVFHEIKIFHYRGGSTQKTKSKILFTPLANLLNVYSKHFSEFYGSSLVFSIIVISGYVKKVFIGFLTNADYRKKILGKVFGK